jgi:hypothetical protein
MSPEDVMLTMQLSATIRAMLRSTRCFWRLAVALAAEDSRGFMACSAPLIGQYLAD